jgi:hypothetical protein
MKLDILALSTSRRCRVGMFGNDTKKVALGKKVGIVDLTRGEH